MVSHVLKNFLEVVPLCPDFYIEGWEESLTRWKGENFVEIQNERISNYRCHFARFFTLIGEGIKQRPERGRSHEIPETKISGTGVNLPRFPHIGVAGITQREERMNNDDEHEAKRR